MRITLKELRNLVRTEVRKKYLRENADPKIADFHNYLNNWIKKNEERGGTGVYLYDDFIEAIVEYAETHDLAATKDYLESVIEHIGTSLGGVGEGSIKYKNVILMEYLAEGDGESCTITYNEIPNDFWPFPTPKLKENSNKISLKELRSLVKNEVRKTLRENIFDPEYVKLIKTKWYPNAIKIEEKIRNIVMAIWRRIETKYYKEIKDLDPKSFGSLDLKLAKIDGNLAPIEAYEALASQIKDNWDRIDKENKAMEALLTKPKKNPYYQ